MVTHFYQDLAKVSLPVQPAHPVFWQQVKTGRFFSKREILNYALLVVVLRKDSMFNPKGLKLAHLRKQTSGVLFYLTRNAGKMVNHGCL